jgi:Arm DNA-binding domain
VPIIAMTDRRLASLKPAAQQVDYFDRAFPGFGLRVSQLGRKSFFVMYRNNERKLVRMMLGRFGTHPPAVTLATARGLARKELQKLATGRDPAAERQVAREQTFGKLAELYLERHAKRRKRAGVMMRA